MLQITDQEHFDKVKEFVATRPQEIQKKFQEVLDYLDTYAEHGDRGKTRCLLGWDFAPYSFSVLMQARNSDGAYSKWWNGGMIYYGAGDSGAGAPNFSVRLGPLVEGWSVNS